MTIARNLSLPKSAVPTSAWALSDGKAGDELQCVAVIEAVGLAPQIRRVAPRAPWGWLMPRGPIDPREAPDSPGSPIAGPFPDLLVASGRRAIAYVRAVRRLSGGRTFTVILKDPRTGPDAADFIWAPEHDRLRGPNVLTTLTSPHRLSPERLAAARLAPPPSLANALAGSQTPRVTVLVGGDSRRHHFTDDSICTFCNRLGMLAASGTMLMVTTSRRTPQALARAIGEVVAQHGGYLWDGAGENPYPAMMALADAVVVTTDSTNMISEAAATGKSVLTFSPSQDDGKTTFLLDSLRARGVVHDFTGTLAGNAYPPLNSTPIIADAIMRAYARAHASTSGSILLVDAASGPEGFCLHGKPP